MCTRKCFTHNEFNYKKDIFGFEPLIADSEIFSRQRLHTSVSILTSRLSCPGLESQHSPKKLSETEVDGNRWLEWLENFDKTHLVLDSGKPVLLKAFATISKV